MRRRYGIKLPNAGGYGERCLDRLRPHEDGARLEQPGGAKGLDAGNQVTSCALADAGPGTPASKTFTTRPPPCCCSEVDVKYSRDLERLAQYFCRRQIRNGAYGYSARQDGGCFSNPIRHVGDCGRLIVPGSSSTTRGFRRPPDGCCGSRIPSGGWPYQGVDPGGAGPNCADQRVKRRWPLPAAVPC